MSSTIIDETVILRYLLNDDEVLSPRAAKAVSYTHLTLPTILRV